MSRFFRVEEHRVPCQHIREYARATANEQEDVLHLAVKQYIPLNNPQPKPGDLTIIGAHANGFPKELYEPFWDELLARSKRQAFSIRGIWIADVAQQGQSGMINEDLLGNDPNWNDHARDLLHLINLKRDQMPRPIVGIGHSMGGNNLVNVALMHPRLFTTLILLDPIIQLLSSAMLESGFGPVVLSTYRRETWPSRKAAAASFKKNKFYQTWDPRVLDRLIEYGLRDLPTSNFSDPVASDRAPPVTLATPKDQEVFTFVRPNVEGSGHNGQAINRKTQPDINPAMLGIYPYYRAEIPAAFLNLPHLRPSVFYIFGETSDMTTPEMMGSNLEITGVGVGGSGGAKEGRVKGMVMKGVGHLIPMEAVEKTADSAAEWIGSELKRWRADEEEHRSKWDKKSPREKRTIDDEWKRMVGPGPGGAKARVNPKL